MGVGHIIFILLNMAVPYWIWTSNSDVIQLDWKNFDKNLARVIEAKNGFEDCASSGLVEVIHELCQQSAQELKETSVAFERGARDFKLICEVRDSGAIVTFQSATTKGPEADGEFQMRAPSNESDLEISEGVEESGPIEMEPSTGLDTGGFLNCRAGLKVQSSPAFHFNTSGWLTQIDFRSRNGIRQSVSVLSCRTKLKRADKIKPAPTTRQEFLTKLPRVSGDPEDLYGANQACLDYDVAARWKNLRKKYAYD